MSLVVRVLEERAKQTTDRQKGEQMEDTAKMAWSRYCKAERLTASRKEKIENFLESIKKIDTPVNDDLREMLKSARSVSEESLFASQDASKNAKLNLLRELSIPIGPIFAVDVVGAVNRISELNALDKILPVWVSVCQDESDEEISSMMMHAGPH